MAKWSVQHAIFVLPVSKSSKTDEHFILYTGLVYSTCILYIVYRAWAIMLYTCNLYNIKVFTKIFKNSYTDINISLVYHTIVESS